MTASHTGPGEPHDLAARVRIEKADDWCARSGKPHNLVVQLNSHQSTSVALSDDDLRSIAAQVRALLPDTASSDDTEPEADPGCHDCGGGGVLYEAHDGGQHPIHCSCTAAQPAAERCVAHGVAESYEASAGYIADPNCTCPRTPIQPAAEPGDVEVAHVLTTHADPEEYARIWNIGYEAAVTQGLADDPTLASDWLARHDAEVAARALRDTARSIEGMATASQYGPHRRAGMHDAAARCERLAEYAEGTR